MAKRVGGQLRHNQLRVVGKAEPVGPDTDLSDGVTDPAEVVGAVGEIHPHPSVVTRSVAAPAKSNRPRTRITDHGNFRSTWQTSGVVLTRQR